MGTIVNNYELLEQLGQGGMGVVYKARHIHFDEIYAIKRLWEQFGANEMVLNLFLNEAKILRKLNHKNIVQVTDVFSLENQNYIVMEYIKGRSLDEIIKKEVGPIRRERAINLFKQMLAGIAYIHNQPTPIIHRDIKPLNLLVTEDDTVKITDFGIAKALDAGGHASTVVKGTPVYMSPEQIINLKSVDIRTDVYSLGMTFYEMLCGRTPFSGDTTTTPTAVYAAIINSEVPPPTHFYPGITEALSDFVMKAIHKDRYRRFTDANEMLRELEKLESSGATTFQEVPKFVQPVVNKSVPGQPTFAEPKRPESDEKPVPKYVIKPQSKQSNNIWKWVARIVVVLASILVVIIIKKEKDAAPISLEGGSSHKDTIIVQKAGKLIMINEKGVELNTLAITQTVFDFIWINSDLLIYTSLEKNKMSVYRYNMKENSSSTIVALPEKTKKQETQGMQDFWFLDLRRGIAVIKDRLFVPCDYEFYNPVEYFNHAYYVVNLKTNKYTYLNTDRDKDQKKLAEYGYPSDLGKYNQSQKEVEKLLKVGKDGELYYSKGTESIRISNTPYKKFMGEGEPGISFDLSPNADKILFTAIEAVGDAYHGRVYMVNPTGTDQQIICSDLSWFIGFASNSSGYSFIVENDYNEAVENGHKLKSITNTNIPELIMSNIQNAKLRQENNWNYMLGRGGSPYY